jgi:hypothetical protein
MNTQNLVNYVKDNAELFGKPANTRSSRARRAQVTNCTSAMRFLLRAFVHGERHEAIKLINSIRPVHIMETVLERAVQPAECTLYLQAIDHVPAHLQPAVQAAKAWQDTAQTARKMLQGTDTESKPAIIARFRSIIRVLEGGKL